MFDKLSTWFSPKNSSPTVTASQSLLVYSPVGGQIVPLEQVSDPVFSQKMLGDGIAIEPSSSQILAPFDGTIIAVFPTGHAIGLRSLTGLECLIHIGIDTVTLNGQGFNCLVKQDQQVTKGTPLIELNLALLKASGKVLTTPLVITNSADWQIEQRWDQPTIMAGTQLLFTARAVAQETAH